jgi:hypothetical protein
MKSRRSLLKTMATGVALAGTSRLFAPRTVRAQGMDRGDKKFLFVVAAAGGGSLLDSFLPIAESESPNAQSIITYPDADIATVGNLRCVQRRTAPNLFSLRIDGHLQTFLENHGADTAILTQESTSVNHAVAQKRSMTGGGIHQGKTLLEAAAIRHGQGLLLPAVNMCESGYLEPGDDVTVPDSARAVAVADAVRFAFAADGNKGLLGVPQRSLIGRMRRVRAEMETQSVFGHTFKNAPLRSGYIDKRDNLAPQLEAIDAINKLTMVRDAETTPLSAYGLTSSIDEPALRARFPALQTDPLQAQAALAFLLVKNGLSCAVAISPSFNPLLTINPNPPIAFDFSHTNHMVTQYAMWSRIMRVTDGLIGLLKETLLVDGDPSQGTLWDRSVVYVATDFGRDKTRPDAATEFGTGHHLNNGNVIVSPLVRGNRVYGGMDSSTGFTYGFDRTSGAAVPGALMNEGDIYSAVAHALDVPFATRLDMPAIVRAA